MQLAGPGVRSFGFRVMNVLKEALLEHPNPEVRTLQDLENVLHLRVVLGGPAQEGKSDPDGVGFIDWNLVMYSSSLAAALDLINFTLDYKVRKGIDIASKPGLAVHLPGEGGPNGLLATGLPSPWLQLSDTSIILPKPFAALPPKGRRHVLAQLERRQEVLPPEPAKTQVINSSQEEEEEEGENQVGEGSQSHSVAGYTLTFFGNIFPFKDRFEDKGIPMAYTVTNAAEQRSYVRYLNLTMDDTSKQQVLAVLRDVLKGLPLYFINTAGEHDPMASWLQQQPSVAETEAAEAEAADASA